jgi:hypothetical protein
MTSTSNTKPIDAAERARRSAYVRDTKGALLEGITFEERTKRLEDKADQWAAWLQYKMSEVNCSDPGRVLPDALARLELIAADRAMEAVAELKKRLSEVLK